MRAEAHVAIGHFAAAVVDLHNALARCHGPGRALLVKELQVAQKRSLRTDYYQVLGTIDFSSVLLFLTVNRSPPNRYRKRYSGRFHPESDAV